MSTPDLPREIYYIKVAGTKSRPYASAAYMKSAIKTRWRGNGKWLKIYVAVITDRLGDWPEGWVDVTREFLDEDGNPKW